MFFKSISLAILATLAISHAKLLFAFHFLWKAFFQGIFNFKLQNLGKPAQL